MLSARASHTSAQLDVPWRFPPRPARYDPKENPQGTVVFNLAENALIYEEIEHFMRSRLDLTAETLTYAFSTGGGPRLPKAMATHLNEYFHPHEPLIGENIIFTASATSLHSVLAFSVGDPGDGVLISRPGYGRFEIDFSFEAAMQVVWADTEAETCFDPDVVASFEEALVRSNAAGVKIKALMIINPHNPLGRCYPRNTLIGLMKLCQKHRINLISDEIYGLSVFDTTEGGAVPFSSVLSIDSAGVIDAELLHVIYGLAKDYGCPGLRLGALVTRSKPMLKSARALCRFHGVSGLSVALATAMLEDRVWCRAFASTMRARLAEAHRLVTGELRAIGIEYLRGSNAGLFVWIDLSPYLPPAEGSETSHARREIALAERLFEGGVLLQPLDEHSLRPGWFRLVYTNRPEIVREGVRRLGNIIKKISWEVSGL